MGHNACFGSSTSPLVPGESLLWTRETTNLLGHCSPLAGRGVRNGLYGYTMLQSWEPVSQLQERARVILPCYGRLGVAFEHNLQCGSGFAKFLLRPSNPKDTYGAA